MRQRLVNAVLAAGSSQVFWYASLPLITRLYGQDGMGLYGLFITYSAVVSLIVGARADLALLTSQPHRLFVTRSAFFKLSLFLALGALICVSLLSLLRSDKLPLSLGILIVFGGLLGSRFMIDGAALIKLDRFTELRRSAFTRSAVQSGVQCLAYVFGHYGLILGRVIGDSVGIALRVKSIAAKKKEDGWRNIFSLSAREKVALRSNRNAYKYSFPQTLVNSVSQGLPLFFLPYFVPLSWLGQYTLAFTIVVAPLGLLATPIRQVMIGKFSEARKAPGSLNEVRGIALRWSIYLLCISLVGAAVLHLVSVPVVTLIFGDEWFKAAGLVALLWWWAGSGLTMTPAIAALLARGGNKEHLVIEVIILVGRAASLTMGVKLMGAESAIVAFVAWSAAANLGTTIWALRKC